MTKVYFKANNSVDFLKLFFAYAVVAIHTSFLYENGSAHDWLDSCLTSLAVPFFFVSSGYFLGVKLQNVERVEYKCIIKKYIYRLLVPLLVWGSINLGVSCLRRYMEGTPINTIATTTIHQVLVSGPGGALWYVQTLLWLCLLMLIGSSRKYIKGITFALGVAFVLFPIAEVLQNDYAWLNNICNVYTKVFFTDRNFVFHGIYFMVGFCIGNDIWQLKKKEWTKYYFLTGCICAFLLFLTQYYLPYFAPLYFKLLYLILVSALLLWGLNSVPSGLTHDFSLKCRSTSSVVYFTHILVKLFVQLSFMVVGLQISYNLLFFAVCLITTLISMLVIQHRERFKILNRIF